MTDLTDATIDQSLIDGMFRRQAKARKVWHDAIRDRENYKFDLARLKARAVMEGEIAGRNKEEREAAEFDLFVEQLVVLRDLETAEREARLEDELAGIDVKWLFYSMSFLGMFDRREKGLTDD